MFPYRENIYRIAKAPETIASNRIAFLLRGSMAVCYRCGERFAQAASRCGKTVQWDVDMQRRKRTVVVATCGLTVLVVAVLTSMYGQDIAAWYRFIVLFERIGPNQQGYTEYRHRETGIVMVRVPGGTFMMGSSEEELKQDSRRMPSARKMGESFIMGFLENESRHRVTLSSFLIAKYEVTRAEWKQVMGDHESISFPSLRKIRDKCPAMMVGWHGTQDFCRKTGLRLPSEAQWEYACRAGNESSYAGSGNLDEMGWYDENSGGMYHPVGAKKPNGFGIYDMHGNVAEWCVDEYDPGFYTKPEASKKNPVCAVGVGTKVQRGGGYESASLNVRSASRSNEGADTQRPDTGFRPVYYPLP